MTPNTWPIEADCASITICSITSFCLKSNAKIRFSSEQVFVVIHITQQKLQVHFHKVKMIVVVNTLKTNTKIIAENP